MWMCFRQGKFKRQSVCFICVRETWGKVSESGVILERERRVSERERRESERERRNRESERERRKRESERERETVLNNKKTREGVPNIRQSVRSLCVYLRREC